MQRMRQVLVSTVLLLAGAAHASTANLSLTGAGAQAVQTGETTWLLEKVGARNGATVSWVIGATPQPTLANQLVLVGHVTVTNSGTGPATIGNIVVNLQTREGKQWVTRSTDVADATDGDDAITANIHKAASSEGLATFSENSASGKLEFMDATNNTVFSLVPQVSIPAGVSRALLFQASFDNNVLNLAVGTQFRSETIVSFGNATANGNGASNVDINGDGTLDADEARVRSIPSRLTLTVPAAVNGNSTPTLTDTIDDVATTGTVTFTNAQFNIGPTTGTVTATVAGGTDGGTITNCAHLTTPDQTVNSGGNTFTTVQGLNLQTCSQVVVPGTGTPPVCQPGQVPCRWRTGDLITRTQLAWDSSTTWFGTYDAIYAATFGTMEVGIPGANGFSMRFSAGARVNDYFLQTGTPAALTKDLDDTSSSSSGQFGAEVVALRLNVDFSAAGQLGGTSGLSFGSLTLCNMSDASLNGVSVNGVLGTANTLLGGGSAGSFTISAIHDVVTELNFAFLDGTPSTYATDHLYNGACPVRWKNGDLVTYSQLQWGTASTTAGNLLGTNFVSLYGTSFVVGGIHTLTFRLADALFAYLPDSASAGVLTGSLLDPVSSSGGGQLAGEVIALQLNVDFSEANILSSVTSLGDLHICNTGLPTLDGLTVSEFLSIANTLLGGGSAPYNVAVATGVASAVNDAFAGGTPSTFAQASLYSGACPVRWKSGDLVTYSQTQWGFSSTAAGALLNANFASLYGSDFEVGGLFTINFRTAGALFNYLPDTFSAGVLTGSLVDPSTSSGGELAGEVIALQLNVDFSAANLVPSLFSLGDLYLCNTGFANLDGQTVNQFLAAAHARLGGGSSPVSLSLATPIARALNEAFADGTPSSVAQANLFSAPCTN